MKDAEPNDWIIISDLDEIPNLENIDFNSIKNKFLFFQQSMMYYKFNLKLDNFTWTGSRACKLKHLRSWKLAIQDYVKCNQQIKKS